jgi:hypothetical protein
MHNLTMFMKRTYPQIPVECLVEVETSKVLLPWDRVKSVGTKIAVEHTTIELHLPTFVKKLPVLFHIWQLFSTICNFWEELGKFQQFVGGFSRVLQGITGNYRCRRHLVTVE